MNKLYSQITSLEDLSPSQKTNKLFERLVDTALDTSRKNTLSTREISKLQLVCAMAEYQLEKYWVEKILKSGNPKKELLKFPYYQNYMKLTRLEWFSLLSCTKHKSHNAIFIGSGPLPLTAIVLAKNYTKKITILDIDKEACDLSQKLINKLGLSRKIKVINIDGTEFENYKDYNLVFVAALAGIDKKNKENILVKIRKDTKKETHVLARSSWGMRKILYKPLDKKLFKIFKPLIEVRPHNDVVNSVVVFENI